VGVGIDESTALVVNPGHCAVVGENQVIVFHRPQSFKRNNDRIGLNNMRIDIYLDGDTFNLEN
jgi:cyanophycinase-like exopeptidase